MGRGEVTEAEARHLLSSLPTESRNIPRRSRALVIDRLRAAVEALLCAQAGVPSADARSTHALHLSHGSNPIPTERGS